MRSRSVSVKERRACAWTSFGSSVTSSAWARMKYAQATFDDVPVSSSQSAKTRRGRGSAGAERIRRMKASAFGSTVGNMLCVEVVRQGVGPSYPVFAACVSFIGKSVGPHHGFVGEAFLPALAISVPA